MNTLELMTTMVPALLESKLDAKTRHDVLWMVVYMSRGINN